MGYTRTVYLLHFSRPLAHARHYLGSTNDVHERVSAHKNGLGARITQVAHELGIELHLVRTWEKGGRALERRLKDRHDSPSLCPKCREKRKRAKARARKRVAREKRRAYHDALKRANNE